MHIFILILLTKIYHILTYFGKSKILSTYWKKDLFVRMLRILGPNSARNFSNFGQNTARAAVTAHNITAHSKQTVNVRWHSGPAQSGKGMFKHHMTAFWSILGSFPHTTVFWRFQPTPSPHYDVFNQLPSIYRK